MHSSYLHMDSPQHEGIINALGSQLSNEFKRDKESERRRVDQAQRQAIEIKVQAAFQEAIEEYVLWLASLRLEYMTSLTVIGAQQRQRPKGIMDALDSQLNITPGGVGEGSRDLGFSPRFQNYRKFRPHIHDRRRTDQAQRQSFLNKVQAAFQEAFEEYVLWLASLRLEYMTSLTVIGARQRQRQNIEEHEGERRRRFIDSEESMSFLDITNRHKYWNENIANYFFKRQHIERQEGERRRLIHSEESMLHRNLKNQFQAGRFCSWLFDKLILID